MIKGDSADFKQKNINRVNGYTLTYLTDSFIPIIQVVLTIVWSHDV